MLERQLLGIGRPTPVEDAARDRVAGQRAGGAGRPSRTLRSLPVEFIRRLCSLMLRDSLSDVRAAALRRPRGARGHSLSGQCYGRAGRSGSVILHMKSLRDDASAHRTRRRKLRES
jgi:hypothetical protein